MPRFALDEALHLIDKTHPTVMPGRADAVQRAYEPFQDQEPRPLLAQVLPVGRRGASRRGQATVRDDHRLQGRGRLRPVGDVPGCLRQPARWAGQGRLDRPTAAGHDDLAARSCRSHQRGAAGREGRDLHQGSAGHARLLQAPAGDRRSDGGRVPAHGRRGAHGRGRLLFIEDRIKDLIISSGFNVYPRRIEEAIYEHPSVAEVTVIGIKDAKRGEAPKAFVRLKPGAKATAEDISST